MRLEAKWFVAPLLALATACGRPAPGEARPAYSVSGDAVTYADGAPALASFTSAPVVALDWAAVRTTGRISWDENVTARIYSPVAGRVREILADVQKPVRAGEPLALIDSPDYGQAQADANRAATDRAVAERNLERTRSLFEHGAAAKKELEAAEAEATRSRVEAARAAERLKLLGGRLGTVDQHYDLTTPLAGVVVDRAINPGQEVRPDLQSPLYTVSDPGRLWAFLDLTERDLAAVRRGMPIAVRAKAFPDRVFRGTIEVLGDSLDPATRTVKARGRVENPDRLLKAEMYVDVEVADPDAPKSLAVPSAAVIGSGEDRAVFVEESRGRFRRQAVSVGPERGGLTRVDAGLREGQKVVTEGALLLQSLLDDRS